MVTVYILQSTRRKYRYVGITNDTVERIKRHNEQRSKATKPFAPFRLVLKEEYVDYKEARKRERFLKSGVGRKFLDTVLTTM